jgi:hypothetical protein
MKVRPVNSFLSPDHRRSLNEELARIPPKLRSDFKKAFAGWKNTWFSGGLAINSDPSTRAVGREYDALIALGPTVLALVVEALADPENFFALQLYDAMQPNEQLIVQYEPDDERILEGEQGRAQRVVQTWFANR